MGIEELKYEIKTKGSDLLNSLLCFLNTPSACGGELHFIAFFRS
jgi:hypothetical protein